MDTVSISTALSTKEQVYSRITTALPRAGKLPALLHQSRYLSGIIQPCQERCKNTPIEYSIAVPVPSVLGQCTYTADYNTNPYQELHIDNLHIRGHYHGRRFKFLLQNVQKYILSILIHTEIVIYVAW